MADAVKAEERRLQKAIARLDAVERERGPRRG